MKKYFTITVMILLLLPSPVLGQSAIGQKANYANSWPAIEYESDNAVVVGVHDQRPYIINGQKSPTYVGTVRGGFGNPWDVNTQSDKPLSDDISSAVVSGLKRLGTQAESVSIAFSDEHQVALGKLKQSGAQRIVLITLQEWRSDRYKNSGFYIDAILRVYDKNGKELGSSFTSHKNTGSGDGSVEDTFDAARSYLSKLLNDPKIKTALLHVSGTAMKIKTEQEVLADQQKERQPSGDMSELTLRLQDLESMKKSGTITESEYVKLRQKLIERY